MASGISGRTKLCGVFGCPVEHSFSPAMQNAAFQAAGLDYAYLPFFVAPEHLAAAVESVKALGMIGVNITVPHKEAVLPLLDELTDEARLAGAVNTVVNRHRRLCGDNTDGKGFLWSLLENAGFVPTGKTALILGAGGAARAVSVSLAMCGAKKMVIANRSKKRAEELARVINVRTGASAEVVEWPEDNSKNLPGEALQSADLVVQTTTLGMFPEVSTCAPLPFELIRPGQVACDLVYNPVRTAFLKKASRAGATVVGGLGMLLYQGALAFELWTGLAAPLEAMNKALKREYLMARKKQII